MRLTKSVLTLSLFILLIFIVISLQIKTFYTEDAYENLTFAENENKTINISIYRYANITSSSLDLTILEFDNLNDSGSPSGANYAPLNNGRNYGNRFLFGGFKIDSFDIYVRCTPNHTASDNISVRLFDIDSGEDYYFKNLGDSIALWSCGSSGWRNINISDSPEIINNSILLITNSHIYDANNPIIYSSFNDYASESDYMEGYKNTGDWNSTNFSDYTPIVTDYGNGTIIPRDFVMRFNFEGGNIYPQNITGYLNNTKIFNFSGFLTPNIFKGESNYPNVTDNNESTGVLGCKDVYINFSRTTYTYPNKLITNFIDSPETASSIYCFNYTSNNYVDIEQLLTNGNQTTILPNDCFDNNGLNPRIYYDLGCFGGSKPEIKESYINSSFSNNSEDFSSGLNLSINNGLCDCVGCSLSGELCTLGLLVESEFPGKITLSNLNINFTESINPSLDILSPSSGIAKDINIEINASDYFFLSTCYYNITRGDSLEKADEFFNLTTQTDTYTVTGDATYVLHVQCNDTSGNINYTNKTFTIDAGNAGGGSSPSTTGQTTTQIATNFSITTLNSNKQTDILIPRNSARGRTRTLQLNNLGLDPVDVELSCDSKNVNLSNRADIDICNYVKFSRTEITIAPSLEARTLVDVTIDIPKGNSIGDVFYFNILATEKSGSEEKVSQISVSARVTYLATIFYKWSRWFETDSSNGFLFPTLLFDIIVGFLLFVLSIFLTRKSLPTFGFLIGILLFLFMVFIPPLFI